MLTSTLADVSDEDIRGYLRHSYSHRKQQQQPPPPQQQQQQQQQPQPQQRHHQQRRRRLDDNNRHHNNHYADAEDDTDDAAEISSVRQVRPDTSLQNSRIVLSSADLRSTPYLSPRPTPPSFHVYLSLVNSPFPLISYLLPPFHFSHATHIHRYCVIWPPPCP